MNRVSIREGSNFSTNYSKVSISSFYVRDILTAEFYCSCFSLDYMTLLVGIFCSVAERLNDKVMLAISFSFSKIDFSQVYSWSSNSWILFCSSEFIKVWFFNFKLRLWMVLWAEECLISATLLVLEIGWYSSIQMPLFAEGLVDIPYYSWMGVYAPYLEGVSPSSSIILIISLSIYC